MRKILYILFVLCCLPVQGETFHAKELEDVLLKLDQMILRQDEYRQEKENRIVILRKRLNGQVSPEEQFHNNKLLYEEYYVYDSDSAMAYIDRNLAIASQLNRKDWKYVWQINKSFLLSATGLLKEAEDALNEVPRQELSDADLLTDYFGQMIYLWSHFGQYTGSQNEEVQRDYLDKERMYRDSVYQVVQSSHPLYLWYKGCYYQYQGEEAMRQVLPELRKVLDGKEWDNRYDAMNAYILGSIYRDLGDMENYVRYLAYSAMADVVSCNKDIASLEELGSYLFSLGDIDRATLIRTIACRMPCSIRTVSV